MKRKSLLGINFSCITMDEALEYILKFLEEDKLHTIFTPNAEIAMEAQRDPDFKKILNSSDMLIPDGAGVILSSKILNIKLPQKIPGFDLTRNSFSLQRKIKTKYFFFGGKDGIAEKAAERVLHSYNNIEISGCQSGYFKKEDEEAIINKINSSNTEFLLVGLGAPKQEKWIHENRDKLNVKVCIGVGGTIDILAGNVKLTPDFFRRNGLEWLYRLYKEPRRFKRMLDLPRFILLSFKKRILN
ncbi:MAG: WecB/TagA/CpsF family glycosyltransferase [Clostridiales bacterium]